MPSEGPKASSITPPTAGPPSSPSVRAIAISRTALCRLSRPAMSWMSICDAGAQNTPAMPWIVNSTTACQTCSVSVTNSTPQPSEHSMNSSMPNWMMRRVIEAVGERARPDRKQQERQPVRDHRIAGQRRRVEFLVDHPVADDVLDRVRHHRQHGAAEIGAVAGLAQRDEGAMAWAGTGRLRSRHCLAHAYPPRPSALIVRCTIAGGVL